MNPLQAVQRLLTWLCGAPPAESDTKREKIYYILFTIYIAMGHVLSVIAGAMFIYRQFSVDLEQTFYSLFSTLGSFGCLYQCIATIILSRKLNTVIQNLTKIYTESEN